MFRLVLHVHLKGIGLSFSCQYMSKGAVNEFNLLCLLYLFNHIEHKCQRLNCILLGTCYFAFLSVEGHLLRAY